MVRKILFLLPPERAHRVSLGIFGTLIKVPFIRSLVKSWSKPRDLPISCLGLEFRNPVGLAAGFDKNGQHTQIMQSLNFGFIEIGSVTNRSWSGNLSPRLFRLKKDQGIINRMGLNNEGAEMVARRLDNLDIDVPLFINIAKTPDKTMSEDETIQDYCSSVRILKPYGDVIVLNISCPNADGGRTFEDPQLLESLLVAVRMVLTDDEKPLIIKVSPDLSEDEIKATVSVCERFNIAGYTATNTTTKRGGLRTKIDVIDRIGNGGMSGKPLHEHAVKMVKIIRSLTEKPIIGVGGIFDTRTAQDFMDAGADLVQIYSGFVYRGPMIVRQVCQQLTVVKREGQGRRASAPFQ